MQNSTSNKRKDQKGSKERNRPEQGADNDRKQSPQASGSASTSAEGSFDDLGPEIIMDASRRSKEGIPEDESSSAKKDTDTINTGESTQPFENRDKHTREEMRRKRKEMNDPDAEEETKLEAKREYNRLNAIRVRQRKKVLVDELKTKCESLEKQVKELTQKNEVLSAQMGVMNDMNRSLSERLRSSEALTVKHPPPAPVPAIPQNQGFSTDMMGQSLNGIDPNSAVFKSVQSLLAGFMNPQQQQPQPMPPQLPSFPIGNIGGGFDFSKFASSDLMALLNQQSQVTSMPGMQQDSYAFGTSQYATQGAPTYQEQKPSASVKNAPQESSTNGGTDHALLLSMLAGLSPEVREEWLRNFGSGP